jgi:hypothetical protein
MKAPSDINLLRVVESAGVTLRRSGREYVGLCPFHVEKTPSFAVNPEKNLWHCFGCGAGGNAITFVMKMDGVSFKEASSCLGIIGEYTPRPRANTRTLHAAALLAGWLNQQYLLLGVRLRELSRQIAVAERISDTELVDSLGREWEIISDLHGDLQRPKYAEEFWSQRDSIEGLTRDVELEPLDEFPPLTESYRAYLRSVAQ